MNNLTRSLFISASHSRRAAIVVREEDGSRRRRRRRSRGSVERQRDRGQVPDSLLGQRPGRVVARHVRHVRVCRPGAGGPVDCLRPMRAGVPPVLHEHEGNLSLFIIMNALLTTLRKNFEPKRPYDFDCTSHVS
jgi:hypothetical protein